MTKPAVRKAAVQKSFQQETEEVALEALAFLQTLPKEQWKPCHWNALTSILKAVRNGEETSKPPVDLGSVKSKRLMQALFGEGSTRTRSKS